jgi:putative flippase GtrA
MCPNGVSIQQAKDEFLTISRFAVVGVIATVIHVGIVWILITQISIEPLPANLVAFLTAFTVSFSGQYIWTFRSSRNWKSAIIRFFTIAFIGFLFNNVVLITLLAIGFLSDSHAAVLSACVIPVISYFAGRFWAFK